MEWKTGVRFLVEERYFPHLHSVQIGSGTRSISYAVCNGALFPEENLPGCEADHSPPYSAEIKNDGGRAMPQAVSPCLPTAAARVRVHGQVMWDLW
jgi:hypothetical protein